MAGRNAGECGKPALINCGFCNSNVATPVLARETDDAMSIAPSERHKFTYQGKSVYEWDQTLSEVNIYITVPAGVTAKQLYVNIERRHIELGVHPNPPYLTKDLGGYIKPSESFWTLDGTELQLQLTKAQKGEPWDSALEGHQLLTAVQAAENSRLLLERFQEEHPGFDFSGAEVSGEAPNPRTFLGGLRH